MYKKTIKYTDYDDVERTEDFYFNISRAEVIEMDAVTPGGFLSKLRRIVKSPHREEVWNTFKELITCSIGRKTDDGRRFEKSDEITKQFLQCEAYSVLLDEFMNSSESAAEFVKAIFPKEMLAASATENANQPMIAPVV